MQHMGNYMQVMTITHLPQVAAKELIILKYLKKPIPAVPLRNCAILF